MGNIFAALALEAAGGFAIAGVITRWLRSHLNRSAVSAVSE